MDSVLLSQIRPMHQRQFVDGILVERLLTSPVDLRDLLYSADPNSDIIVLSTSELRYLGRQRLNRRTGRPA